MTWKIRKFVGMEMNANLTHNVAKKENAKKIMGKLTKIQSTFSILLFGQKKECLDADAEGKAPGFSFCEWLATSERKK